MTERYKWLGTSDLTIPETEKSVRTGQEFEMNDNQLAYNGIQVLIKNELLVKVMKVTGVKPIDKVEAKEEKTGSDKPVSVKGIKPLTIEEKKNIARQ